MKISIHGSLIGLAMFSVLLAGAAAAAKPERGQGAGRDRKLPQAHTTPSGVTTAQPGGGNPYAKSDRAATPASRAAQGAPALAPAPGTTTTPVARPRYTYTVFVVNPDDTVDHATWEVAATLRRR